MTKVLIVAGTHTRENGLSYKVLDSIDDRLHTRNQHVIAGGGILLRTYGDLATARIVLPEYPKRAQYKRRFHWTEVHEEMLGKVNPSFFIDLHSWHKFGLGSGNTGAYIKPHAKPEHLAAMEKYFRKAQQDRPNIYGTGEAQFIDKSEVEASLLKRMIRKKSNLQKIKLLLSRKARSDVRTTAHARALQDIASQWGNNWFLLQNDEHNVSENFGGYSCFTIEGIDEERSKKPIVDFILDYVLPETI